MTFKKSSFIYMWLAWLATEDQTTSDMMGVRYDGVTQIISGMAAWVVTRLPLGSGQDALIIRLLVLALFAMWMTSRALDSHHLYVATYYIYIILYWNILLVVFVSIYFLFSCLITSSHIIIGIYYQYW